MMSTTRTVFAALAAAILFCAPAFAGVGEGAYRTPGGDLIVSVTTDLKPGANVVEVTYASGESTSGPHDATPDVDNPNEAVESGEAYVDGSKVRIHKGRLQTKVGKRWVTMRKVKAEQSTKAPDEDVGSLPVSSSAPGADRVRHW